MRTMITLLTALGALLIHTTDGAAATEAVKCTVAKMKATAQYTSCRLSADAKAATTGDPASYDTCDTKQLAAFAKAELKYGLDCPTTGDQAGIRTDVSATTTCLSDRFATGSGDCSLATAQSCGNGVLDLGEVCDGSQLGGATCASALGNPNKQGAITCRADCTGVDTTQCLTCPGYGTVLDGGCWIYGAEGASCTATCAAAAMTYDDRTRTYAGSAGKLSRCSNVLLALGADSVEFGGAIETTTFGGLGLGCFKYHFSWYRDTDATTANGAESSSRRACACH